jgi:hypothetical protein
MSDGIKFDELDFEVTVLVVLRQAEKHRGQRVYMPVYDLAARVAEKNSRGFAELGWPLTGTTDKVGNSFTAYLGSALVRRIDGGYLNKVEYVYAEDAVMFRLRAA